MGRPREINCTGGHHQVFNAAVNMAALFAWNQEVSFQQRKKAANLYRLCREVFNSRFGPNDADTKDCAACLKDLLAKIEKEKAKIKDDKEKRKKEKGKIKQDETKIEKDEA